jgi:hypothetical protein
MNSTATSSQQENRISMSGKTNKLDLSSQMPNLTLTSPKSSSGRNYGDEEASSE